MSVNKVNKLTGDILRIAGGTIFCDLPIGAEIEYPGSTAPTGFLKCDGSSYSQSTYPALYAVLGTTTLPNKSGYIIKAVQFGAPTDFTVDAVQDGNLKAVTSNAVFDLASINKIDVYSSTEQIDILQRIDILPVGRVSFARWGGARIINSPYSVGEYDCDCICVVYKINGSNDWYTAMLYDVRTNNVFVGTKANGIWLGWERVTTEKKYTAQVTDLISSGGGNYSYLEKVGRCVKCICRFSKEEPVTLTENQIIGTIPYGFRPTYLQPVSTVNFDSNGAVQTFFRVETDGNILAIPITTTGRLDIYINLMWFTDE